MMQTPCGRTPPSLNADMPLTLLYMGTPAFAVPPLAALLEAGHRVVGVYTQPPRPAGRGQKLTPSLVEAFARAQGLPVFSPTSLRSPEIQAQIRAHQADAIVVAAYGLLLPQAVLDAARLGCLNIHPSLLPRWRGAAPIPRTILAGDTETGVAIMRMDAGLDTGPVLSLERVAVDPQETAQTLHDRLSVLGGKLLTETLSRYAAGELSPVPQTEEGVTYATKLTKEEGRIDWARPASEIERQVRGLTPWPCAWFTHAGESIKLLSAQVVEGKQAAEPGTVVAAPLTIACGEGTALALRTVQRPGKRAMEARECVRGWDMPVGTALGTVVRLIL
jgi:methionyl-tRNA formyltransferase